MRSEKKDIMLFYLIEIMAEQGGSDNIQDILNEIEDTNMRANGNPMNSGMGQGPGGAEAYGTAPEAGMPPMNQGYPMMRMPPAGMPPGFGPPGTGRTGGSLLDDVMSYSKEALLVIVIFFLLNIQPVRSVIGKYVPKAGDEFGKLNIVGITMASLVAGVIFLVAKMFVL